MKYGTKTETLSLRLDPKTKFILEFVARIRGQTLTTIVVRAIRQSCDLVTVGDQRGLADTWESFWDPDEGIRTLSLLACLDYPTTYDEDDLREFTKAHWDSYYLPEKSGAPKPKRALVGILWPKIDEYRRIWHAQRNSDYWAAGKAMAADLSAAQVTPPSWPPRTTTAITISITISTRSGRELTCRPWLTASHRVDADVGEIVGRLSLSPRSRSLA